MKRRQFLKNSGTIIAGSALVIPATLASCSSVNSDEKKLQDFSKNQSAKNIIFLVSDGMSMGTLTMTESFLQTKEGKSSNWVKLYAEGKSSRCLMETSSASSNVTDSAAASSAWGGGQKVPNGKLNINAVGEELEPLWTKFKNSGKSIGVVTTVPVTHATPAGFCVNAEDRNNQELIAEKYLKVGLDVILGGGKKYFSADQREDKVDVLGKFGALGYELIEEKSILKSSMLQKPLLGLFGEDALPYSIDQAQSVEDSSKVPTLAEMTEVAIKKMATNTDGFVLQVEAGKVDWAAHGNDIGALIHDQLAFDEAINVAYSFAKKNPDTLLVVTTDHGNSNPGTIYGKDASVNFDKLQSYTSSNANLLTSINFNTSVPQLQELIMHHQKWHLNAGEAKKVIEAYRNLSEEDISNYRKLPFNNLSELQGNENNIGWMSNDHSSDFVELLLVGPGHELLPHFIPNNELHNILLHAAGIA